MCGMGGSVCGLQGEFLRGIEYIQVFIHGENIFVVVWRKANMSSLEEKKRRVISTKKWRKNLAGYELGEDLLKEDIQGDILLG